MELNKRCLNKVRDRLAFLCLKFRQVLRRYYAVPQPLPVTQYGLNKNT
jgi:hypothetical protein